MSARRRGEDAVTDLINDEGWQARLQSAQLAMRVPGSLWTQWQTGVDRWQMEMRSP